MVAEEMPTELRKEGRMIRALCWTLLVMAASLASRAWAQVDAARPPSTPPAPSSTSTSGGLPGGGTLPATSGAPRTLRVSGDGRAQVAPDLAVATIAVTAVDASLAKATRDTAEGARRVLEALGQAGVARADLQTSRYDVQIERRAPKSSEPPRITGYRVTNAIRAKVRDLSKLGAILDRVVGAGANELEGLAFLKEDPSAERSRALGAAVRDARARAEDIARAAGLRLGPVLEIVEGARAPVPISMSGRMMAMSAAEVPVEPGEVEIGARVEILFALQ